MIWKWGSMHSEVFQHSKIYEVDKDICDLNDA